MISLMEKVSINEDNIAGKKPNNFLITKNIDINIELANTAFVKYIGIILSWANADIIAISVWKGG